MLVIRSCSWPIFDEHWPVISAKFPGRKFWLLSAQQVEDSRFSKLIVYPEESKRFEPLRHKDFIHELAMSRFYGIVWVYFDRYGMDYSNIRLLASWLRAEVRLSLNRNGEWSSLDITASKWDLVEEFERSSPEISYLLIKEWLRTKRKETTSRTIPEKLKRLTLVSNTLVHGGTELLLYETVVDLIGKGYEVQLLLGSGGALKPQFDKLSIRMDIYMPDAQDDVIDMRLVPWMRRALEEFGPDAMIVYQIIPCIPALIAGIYAGVPLIIRSANVSISENFVGAFQYRRIVELSELYDKVVSVSHAVAESIKVSDERNVIIPGTIVKASHYSVSRKKVRQSGEPVTFLTVSRLDKEKGLTYLLQAITAIVQTRTDVQFLIAGEGMLAENLKAEARHLQIENFVRFLGRRSDIPELLQRCDAFVLPSLVEGLPMAVIEAMMAGCYIIASDVDGIPELIEHGVDGVLVRPGHVGDLVEAIMNVLTVEGPNPCYGENAREKAIASFTFDRMMAQWENLLKREWSRLQEGPNWDE